jgi:hypothetical protein
MSLKSITLVQTSRFLGYGVLVRKVTVESSAFSFRVQGQIIRRHIPGDCRFILTALHTTDLLLVPSIARNVKIFMHTVWRLVKLKYFKFSRILRSSEMRQR